MHVVSEFQVLSERETLVHGHVTVDFEGHVGDGRSGKRIGRDEFGDNVEPDLNIGDGLNNSARDEENRRHYHRQNHCPPGLQS